MVLWFLQNVLSRVRVRARPSAILHFLLSQPSHASSFLPPFVDRNEGVTTKNVGDFLKNLPRFSDYLPRFFLLLRHSSKSLLLSRKTCCFVPFQLLQLFAPFAPLFLYFLALQHLNIKECLWNRRNYLCFSCLNVHLWRLWKQKELFCRVRARTRTRETLILRLFTSQFPSEHSRVDFLTFKIEVQSTFPATVCS